MLCSRSEYLSEHDLQQIHQTSMRILANVGVDFPCEEAIAVFREHGVKTNGNRVYLSEDQVMAGLSTVPAKFTIQARNPERSVVIGGDKPVFAPGYGAPFLVEPGTGKRVPTMEDYDNLARLAHALPNQDLSGHLMVQPHDLPVHTACVHMLHANMVHSDKPFIGSSEGRAGARRTIEMSSILFGQEVQDQPVTISLINSLSPLGYGHDMLEALMEYVRWRQPVIIAALAMAGLTAPVTLAGTLAMQNAELLAGITLTQLLSPGTPVVYGSTSSNADLRTANLAVGSPELSLMITAHAQMARFYDLPSRSGGALTDASTPDAQAGFESMMSLLTAFNSGIDLVIHTAGILGSYLALSYEKFVLDDEMCGMVRRLHKGIEVTPEALAYDVVAEVGPGGNYLMEMHTVKRCRTEFWGPTLCERSGLEGLMQAGQQDAVARARKRWQRLVAEHQDPPLDGTTASQLQRYVEAHAS
jgi:trimethylamine--corrinoid protein Co-methyltransferase